MKRKRLRLSNYNLLNESKVIITGNTTVSELIAMGMLKSDFLTKSNEKIGRREQKAQVKETRSSQLEIARSAIAYFLVNNYGMIPKGSELHDVRSKKDDKARKIGFGKKPCEIIVGKVFDAMAIEYNRKVGAPGSARDYTNQVFVDLEAQGILTNNRDMVSNNAHVRYGKTSDPDLPESLPVDFPQGKDFPTLKEFMEPLMNDPYSFDLDTGLSGDESEIFYISSPDALKNIADQCNPEVCNIVDQFTTEAMRQDF